MKINSIEIKKLSKISNSFYEDLKVHFLYNSNKLEGSTFSIEGLRNLIEDNLLNDPSNEHPLNDVYETINSISVFDKVINSTNEELNKFLLFDWHRTLEKNTDIEAIGNAGCFKKYENKINKVDIKVALPYEVDNLIENIILDWNKKKIKTIEDIAIFYY